MATRSRTSFNKRQKEIARMEKQREKAAKRMERKRNPRQEPGPEIGSPAEFLDDGDNAGVPETYRDDE